MVVRRSLVLIAAILFSVVGAEGGFDLVKNGRGIAEIRIPAQANRAEVFAAEEMQHYIQRISGATLPIVRDDKMPAAEAVVIGKHPANAPVAEALDAESKHYERFALVGKGKVLHIVAPNANGLLYGTWEYLEQLGVEWLMPGKMGTYVPTLESISVPDMRQFHQPRLEFRSSTNYTDAGEKWMLRQNGAKLFVEELEHGISAATLFAWRMRLNSNVTFEPRDAYVIMGAGHSYHVYLPIERYHKEHPEWFGLRGGVRQKPGQAWQICFNSKPAAMEFAKNAIKSIKGVLARGVPQERILFFVSPNDHEVFCQCDSCNAMIDTDGSYSSNVLHFANMVAKEIHAQYPKVKVTYYVYHSYGRVPTRLKAAPGVYATVTTWSAYNSLAVNSAKPLMSPMGNPIFHKVFDWFAKNTAGVMVYPYYAHYDIFTSWPMQTQMRLDFKVMSKYPNFIGMNSESHLHWANQPLNLYLFPKLLWNPTADTNGLIREFCEKAYGPGGKAAESYFAIQQGQMDRQAYIAGASIEVKDLLSPKVIKACDRVMAEFVRQVPKMDEAQKWRAQLLLDGWKYSKLYAEAMRLLATAQTPDAQKICKDNFATIREFLKTEQGRYAIEERVANLYLSRFEKSVQVNLAALPVGKSKWSDVLYYGSTLKFYSQQRSLSKGLWGFGIPAKATGEMDWTLAAAEGKIQALSVKFLLAAPGIKVYVLVNGKPELVADHTKAGSTGPIVIPERYLNKEKVTLRLVGSNSKANEVIWLCEASMEAEVGK